MTETIASTIQDLAKTIPCKVMSSATLQVDVTSQGISRLRLLPHRTQIVGIHNLIGIVLSSAYGTPGDPSTIALACQESACPSDSIGV